MITEDYVSFETAKRLKERGFVTDNITILVSNDNNHFVSGNSGYDFLLQNGYEVYPAPTLQMAMKWLRDVYKLYIVVRPYVTEEGFFSLFDVKSVKEKEIVVNLRTKTGFTTYEEACKAGIKYCLENLI